MVKASLKRSEAVGTKHGSHKRAVGKAGLDKGVKANRPRSSSPWTYDPGGDRDSSNEGNLSQFPTTEKLAQSFLETEPVEEKAQLKAAIAKSQHLDQSQISEDGDEPSEEGFGTALSLPGFVAGFLKGITDRFSLIVKDIEVSIGMNFESLATRASGMFTEELSFRLSVDAIRLLAVDPNDVEESRGSREDVSDELEAFYRRISITGLRGDIVTDDTLFSAFAQPSETSSPLTAHSAGLPTRLNKSGGQPFAQASSTSSTHGDRRHGDPAQSMISDDLESSEESLRDSGTISETPESEAATDQALERSTSSLTTSEIGFYSSDSRYEGSEASSQTVRSQIEPFHTTRVNDPSSPRAAETSGSRTSRYVPEHSHDNRRNDRGTGVSRFSHPGAFFFDDEQAQAS